MTDDLVKRLRLQSNKKGTLEREAADAIRASQERASKLVTRLCDHKGEIIRLRSIIDEIANKVSSSQCHLSCAEIDADKLREEIVKSKEICKPKITGKRKGLTGLKGAVKWA